MWIGAAALALLTYLALRYQHRTSLHSYALTAYAAELLLRPDLHQDDAIQLRDVIRREGNDRSADRAAWHAIQHFATQAAAARGKAFGAIIAEVRTQSSAGSGA